MSAIALLIIFTAGCRTLAIPPCEVEYRTSKVGGQLEGTEEERCEKKEDCKGPNAECPHNLQSLHRVCCVDVWNKVDVSVYNNNLSRPICPKEGYISGKIAASCENTTCSGPDEVCQDALNEAETIHKRVCCRPLSENVIPSDTAAAQFIQPRKNIKYVVLTTHSLRMMPDDNFFGFRDNFKKDNPVKKIAFSPSVKLSELNGTFYNILIYDTSNDKDILLLWYDMTGSSVVKDDENEMKIMEPSGGAELGIVPTGNGDYVDQTQFTGPGDLAAIYPEERRYALIVFESKVQLSDDVKAALKADKYTTMSRFLQTPNSLGKAIAGLFFYA